MLHCQQERAAAEGDQQTDIVKAQGFWILERLNWRMILVQELSIMSSSL